MSSFSRDRAGLSHNRLKNEFLASIAYHPEDKASGKRNEKLLAALAGDSARYSQIEEAFEGWPRLAEDIGDFLSNLAGRYGFRLAPAYYEETTVVLESLRAVSLHVERFLAREMTAADLESLWEALDVVSGFLSRLGHERHLYVVDVDPYMLDGS